MTTDRWARIQELFAAALERPPAERAAYVREHAEDAGLGAEVLSLLQAHDARGRLDSVADRLGRASSPVADLTGVLSDRYRIERELGRGGMATVYLAHDEKHGRPVALKVLRAELAAILGAPRFLREIAVTARLDHPHILTLIDSGEERGCLYYVVPYVRGESLRAKLARERQLPVDDALRIAHQVASALDYAHGQGVVHRDIKPENILLHEGEAVVADFGIALALREAGGDRLTQSGLSLGTPEYMSPEQATGEGTLDARSDVYSLGAVVYEMLAGEPPHTGATAQVVIAKLLTERPTPLRVIRDTVPAAVEAAVTRALAKTPADRFPTAGAFAAALTAPAPRRVRVSRRVRVGAAGLVLAAAVGGVFWRRGREDLRLVPAGPPRQITTTGEAIFGELSPDSKSLAYTNGFTSGALIVRDLGSGAEVVLYHDSADALLPPRWSPDGSHVMFAPSGGTRLLVVPRLGGPPTVLAQIEHSHIDAYDFVGDDSTVAIGVVRGGRVWLYVGQHPGALQPAGPDSIAGDGTFIDLGSPGRLGELTSVRGSPDGQRVAYALVRYAGRLVIGTAPRSGGPPVAVVTDSGKRAVGGILQPLDWSPRGDALYYGGLRDLGTLLRVRLDRSSGRATGSSGVALDRLGASGAWEFDLAADGSRLVYTDETATRRQLQLVPVTEGPAPEPPQILTAGTASHSTGVISPDGRTLAYLRGAPHPAGLLGPRELVLRPLGGGPERSFPQFPIPGGVWWAAGLAWSPDGRRVAILTGPATDSAAVVVLDAVTGLVVRRSHAWGASRALAWSPDGRTIAFVSGDDRSVLLMGMDDGRESRVAVGDSTTKLGVLVFGPDGRRLAVSGVMRDSAAVRLMDLATGAVSTLVPGGLATENWIWPVLWKGDEVFFFRTPWPVRTLALWRVRTSTGKTQLLGQLPRDCIPRSLTPDHRSVLCMMEEFRSDIWLMDLVPGR